MNDFDPKLLEKLENLEGIEARLARGEATGSVRSLSAVLNHHRP